MSQGVSGVTQGQGGLAQLARAPALHAGGHRFDSDILHTGRSARPPSGAAFAAADGNETFHPEGLVFLPRAWLDTLYRVKPRQAAHGSKRGAGL